MKAILTCVGGLLLCVAWSTVARAQVPAAGYLVSTIGKWATENGTELKLGSAVFPGQLLRSAGTGAGSITIAYLNGGLETYLCQSKDPCVYHVKDVIPKAVSWPEQILLALKNLAARREFVPVNAISRDANALRLRPAVLPLNNNVLDLKAAVTLLDPGSYQFQLKPLVMKAGRQNAPVSGTLLWDAPQRTVADVSGLEPGVYELVMLTADGGRMGAETVLVAGPGDYAQKSAAFEQGREFLDSQSQGTRPAAIHNILTALLFQLEG